MNNHEIAKILYNISLYLEIQNNEPFKPVAYRRAARFVDSYPADLNKVNDLEALPHIGEGIAKKIRELLDTGKLKYYEDLKKSTPINVEELDSVPGIGPKRMKLLYAKLKIKNRSDLFKAAKERKIRRIEGLGPIVERNILENLKFQKKSSKRRLLIEGIESSDEIIKSLKKSKLVVQVNVAGSVRRMKETIGDIDILCTSNKPVELMDYFTDLPVVRRVLAHGPTKSSVLLHNNLQVDLRVIKLNEYGSALVHFTGNKDFNIALRKHFMEQGIKINEYGIYKGSKRFAGETEEGVFKSLKMQYVPPELRENKGELELSLKNKIPRILERKDLLGEFHVHTKWSDGLNTVKEVADYARKELNYSFIGVADHLGNLGIANALNPDEVRKQAKELKDLNSTYSNFKILHNGEVNIKKNGELDLQDKILSKFDYVIASIHYAFKMSKKEMTDRLVKALSNENVKILGHPTCRKLLFRPGVEFDADKVFRTAVENNVWLEINSFPDRMDLDDNNCRLAKEYNAKFVINTDAHQVRDLNYINLGVSIARRAMLTKSDILNTQKKV